METIYKRLKEPEFKRRFNEERRAVLNQTTTIVQRMLTNALATLYKVMQDKESAPQVKVNAANGIISASLRLTEQNDIVSTLDALEEKYELLREEMLRNEHQYQAAATGSGNSGRAC